MARPRRARNPSPPALGSRLQCGGEPVRRPAFLRAGRQNLPGQGTTRKTRGEVPRKNCFDLKLKSPHRSCWSFGPVRADAGRVGARCSAQMTTGRDTADHVSALQRRLSDQHREPEPEPESAPEPRAAIGPRKSGRFGFFARLGELAVELADELARLRGERSRHLDLTTTWSAPLPRPSTRGAPLPFTLMTSPGWVPAGTSTVTMVSSGRSSESWPPSDASANETRRA